AIMSGLLYVSEINARRREPGTPLAEAIVEGARAQFRPQLILIVVAVLGMMPAALARGIGSDIQRPLATVVVGGLSSTLFLTLFPPCLVWPTDSGRHATGCPRDPDAHFRSAPIPAAPPGCPSGPDARVRLRSGARLSPARSARCGELHAAVSRVDDDLDVWR